MKLALELFTLSVFLLYPLAGVAQQTVIKQGATQNSGLTTELVVNLVNAGVPPDQIVEMIRRTPSDFDLTLETIDKLRKDGMPIIVLDAMIKARRTGVAGAFNPPRQQPNPSPSPATITLTLGVIPPTVTPQIVNVPSTTAVDPQRLQDAKKPIPAVPNRRDELLDPGCESVAPGKKVHRVDLDYDTGSSSHSHLDDTGLYCFALRNANRLYDWSVIVNVSEPTGNPFDLLNDAITTLTHLATGAAKVAEKPPVGGAFAATCPSADDIKAVVQKSEALRVMLAAMVPGKGSDGKVAYIPAAETRSRWAPVPRAFREFDEAVRKLQNKLPADAGAAPCDQDLLAQAVSIIVDDYPRVRTRYEELELRLSKIDVFYYARRLEATSSADLVATPSYAGVADGSKTFHFSPSFGILSSSAGFLLTRLPARAYSSVTAPNPADLTQTQNVLSVDFGAGTRPALVVLLTGNLPQLNRRNFGLGISGGPVFDISQGKADTSRFGFFTGASLRITPWVFLTPGIHFGEFADFPAGFTRPGQVIPANTGTPVPVKRYTGRFAFSFTWKLKDLGAVIGSGGENRNQ